MYFVFSGGFPVVENDPFAISYRIFRLDLIIYPSGFASKWPVQFLIYGIIQK